MSGEKRRDFHRVLTAALALLTFTLVYLHLTDRDEAVRTARGDVQNIHEQVRNLLARQVREYKGRLDGWTRETDGVPGIDRIQVLEGTEPPTGMLQVGDGAGRFWVNTTSPETDLVQEGEKVLDPAASPDGLGVALDFVGKGQARIQVEASIRGEAPPDVKEVVLEVLLRKGALPPEPIHPRDPRAFHVVPGSATPSTRPYTLVVDEELLKVRTDLFFRTAADAPPLDVRWEVRMGDARRPEVAIGVIRTLGDRWVSAMGPNNTPQVVRLPGPERVFIVGIVPLADFTREIRRAGLLRAEPWGDHLYVTDVSGTVAEAVPDFPEKIRKRVKAEGRTSLASVATQRVKVRSEAGTDDYEGFGKDRVIGTFGPLDDLNGGLIVEREEKRVLEGWRGLQPWHVSAVLFVVLLLIPAVPPIVRRIREDTELPRLLAYARGFVPHIGAIVVSAVLYSVAYGVFMYQGKVLVDEVLVNEESGAYDRLGSICWLLVGVAVVMFAVNWVKEYLGKFVENHLVVEIRCALCEKIAHLPMAFHSRQRAGELLSRIQNDVAETNRGLEMLFGDVISDPILIVTLAISAFFVNWRLALVVFVGLPVVLAPIAYFGRVIKRSARRRQAKKADVTHAISQMLSGIRVVKAFRMEDHEARRIRDVSSHFLVEAMKVARAQVTSKESLEFFSNLSTVVVSAVGGYLVLERQVTVGDLAAFAALIARMYRSSKSLTGNYNKVQESLAGTERIFEVIDTPDTLADRPTARALVRPRAEIAFENVSFRYVEDGAWVLRNLSFRVPVGTSVALVGATGAGKSTLLDLVARFYDPQEGRITVDGVDLRDYSRDSLLAQVAVVTQEAFLFNATVAENLRYGRLGATQTEIEAAARAAVIHEEILKQEHGYETVVGERGSRLSGGQRQRVTIARAILKDPPILLLDEATSALDSRSERMVQDALYNLMKDRTTFVIAHRLSTIQGVDRILVLDNGAIVEQGTHRELLAIPGGHYRHLHEIQFASALRDDVGGASAAG